MMPLPLDNLSLIAFSLCAHRFQFPTDLPYSPASSTTYTTNDTNNTHGTSQVISDGILKMEIPAISREPVPSLPSSVLRSITEMDDL